MTLRIALVGLGEIHRTHAAALLRVPALEVVAAHDPNPAATCEVDGVERVATFRELTAREDIDGAIIAVPTRAHADLATELMSAGLDVLIEKPIATTLDELRGLYATADGLGRVCFSALHDSVGDEVVHLIDTLLKELRPSIGRLTGVRCAYYDPYGPRDELATRMPSMSGSWLDSGCNALSVVARFVADLTPLEATTTLVTPASPQSEDLAARVRFTGFEVGSSEAESGDAGDAVDVEVETSWLEDRNSKATTLLYEQGRIELDHVQRRIDIVEPRGRVRTIERGGGTPPMVPQYIRVFEEFVTACANRTDNRAFASAVHVPLLQLYEDEVPVTRFYR